MGPALVLALFLAKLCSIHGYAHFVHTKDMKWFSRDEKYFCYTNQSDSAIAFARDLWIRTFEFSDKTKYTGLLGDAFNNGKSDCNLFADCKDVWNVDEFKLEPNLVQNSDRFPPLFDRRWNELTEVVVSNVSNVLMAPQVALLELGKAGSGLFFLSVQAIFAKILFTRRPEASEGFAVTLDDEAESHTIEKWDPPRVKTQLAKLRNKTVLHGGARWSLLAIRFQVAEKTVSIKVDADNETILEMAFANAPAGSGDWKVLLLSDGDHRNASFYKLHKYEVLKPTKRDSEMRLDVEFSKMQPLCLDVTYFSGGGAARKGVAAEIIDARGGKMSKTEIFGASPVDAWATARLKLDQMPTGNYSIAIKVESQATSIGAVTFCVLEPELVETGGDFMESCHTLKAADPAEANFSSSENGLEEEEAEFLCNTVSAENCRGVKYCDGVARCACLSGYLTQGTTNQIACDKSCAVQNKFGTNCKHAQTAKCSENAFNIHSGLCTKGCVDPDMKPPSCSQSVLKLEVGPLVTDIGPYSALLDVTAAMRGLLESRKAELQDFDRVEVQLQKMKPGGKEWSRGAAVTSFNASGPFTFPMGNLRPAYKYKVLALIRDKDDSAGAAGAAAADLNWKTATFKTPQCTSLGEKNIRLEMSGGQVRLRKLVDDPELCRVARVELKVNSSAAGQRSRAARLTEPALDTLDSVLVFGDDKHSFAVSQIAVIDAEAPLKSSLRAGESCSSLVRKVELFCGGGADDDKSGP